MTDTNGLFDYHAQCLSCNLSSSLLDEIHDWYSKGRPYTDMSKALASEHDITISPDALSNHVRFHVNKAEAPQKTDEHDAPQTLLGVVAPVKPPKDWEPKLELTPEGGTLVSSPQTEDNITDFSELIKETGENPDEYDATLERLNRWQIFSGEWRTSYKIKLQRKSRNVNLDDILDIIKDVKPSERPSPSDLARTSKHAFVFAAGDLQLGKSDADGTQGIVRRYRESLQKAVDKYELLAEQGVAGPILVSWVGDCIEGMVSQGGKNARRTELTTTQQVKLLRRLMTETIKAFAPLTYEMRVVSVPGNHDEAQREPVSTDFSDSWAVDALVAVSEALTFNPEAFGHVSCEVVPFDELTTTITIAGTTITHAHGHQWARGKHWDWWQGQAWGGHAPGTADILLCGHLHTGVYEQQNYKHFIRTPAFEKESTYFRHRTGLIGNPSAVSFLTKDGKIKYLDYE